MEILLAYLAGLLTLLNPCVLPVLPIVLGSALQASPRGPLALAAGLCLSFVVLGLVVARLSFSIGLSEELVSRIGAVLMVLFGLLILLPHGGRLGQRLVAAADARIGRIRAGGAAGQFAGGLLLGAVWSPCIGPTLGGAIALAYAGQDMGQAAAVMLSYAAGVATLILAIAYGLRGAFSRNRAVAARIARLARPVLGALFILVGLSILFRLTHLVEAWAIGVLPPWLLDLSVSF